MSQLSDRHLFTAITPEILWSKIDQQHGLLLPRVLQQSAFGHYYESTGEHFGFHMQTPWDALPAGEWKVLVDVKEQVPAEKVTYQVNVSLGQTQLYSGDLTVYLAAVENDTAITISVDGKPESGLAAYSDDLIETILRSLIRESWDAVHRLLNEDSDAGANTHGEGDQLVNHMDPLALAAGVFSAGMALGLWLWRRKRKDENV